ncbi:hypothetical protein D3C75_1313460 [compost metagenome]
MTAFSGLQLFVSRQQRLVGRQGFQFTVDGKQAVEALFTAHGRRGRINRILTIHLHEGRVILGWVAFWLQRQQQQRL